ncbi:MAG: VWA domain-containing protein [Bacteroidota bacterium]
MALEYFHNIIFGQPLFFLLGLLLPVMLVWYIKKNNRRSAAIKVSSSKSFGKLNNWRTSFRHVPFILRLLALAFIITALARPQTKTEQQQAEGEGIDIVLCIDVSGSMTAQDFTPNRMEAAKKVAAEFVDRRSTDRIGIVVFSGESFTQCPLTTDKTVLHAAVAAIRNGLLQDGTAIGDGLSTSVDRLRSSKSKSKVVILLTDGENNGGLIGPDNAKEIAKAFGIKVYTIGVGTDGYTTLPEATATGTTITQQRVAIDEKLLTAIAFETGGKYFRARDNISLENIYKEIDQLEKSKVEIASLTRYTEKFFPLVMIALGLLLLEVVLRFTVLKKFP